MTDLAIVFCPNLSDYPNQPKDQSLCRLVDCPTCNKKMWLSVKKEAVIELAQETGKELILKCYPCFMKWAKKNKDVFKEHGHKRIDL